MHRLPAVRLIIVFLIGIGYASTMPQGPEAREWLYFLGYNPSLYGLQVLFFLSGWLAMRSLDRGRTVRQFLASRARRNLPMVALVTFVVVAGLYPVLCDHDAPIVKSTADLVLYYLKTVSLVAPGQPMPGALDGALYPCKLQGAIWSLRWGAFAYAAFLMLHLMRLNGRAMLLTLTLLCAVLHIAMGWWTDVSGSTLFDPVSTAVRLSFPFLAGAAAFAWRDKLPQSAKGWGTVSAILIGGAFIHYYSPLWSYTIEVTAASGWCALAMALLHTKSGVLKNWPDLALPLYLTVWPTAQTLLWLMPDISVAGLVALTMAVSGGLAVIANALFVLALRPIHGRVQTT